MPSKLAEAYRELWLDVVWLVTGWEDFKVLYADENLRLLKDTAPGFFGDLSRELQFGRILQLCRLSDPEVSPGNKSNLTIQRLPKLLDDGILQAGVQKLVDDAIMATHFARQWRNRRIGHEELPASISGTPTPPLPRAAWQDFDEAIKSIVNVLDALHRHYVGSEMQWDGASGAIGGVNSLLHFLRAGWQAETDRRR